MKKIKHLSYNLKAAPTPGTPHASYTFKAYINTITFNVTILPTMPYTPLWRHTPYVVHKDFPYLTHFTWNIINPSNHLFKGSSLCHEF